MSCSTFQTSSNEMDSDLFYTSQPIFVNLGRRLSNTRNKQYFGRMSGIPTWLNVILSVCSAVLGVYAGLKAHRREPISEASKVLKHSPHLWIVLIAPVALLIFHTLFHLNPNLEWLLPYTVSYYYGPFAWGLVICCFTYFAGFGGAVFLTSMHPHRWLLGVAIAMMFAALQQSHLQASQRQPAYSRANAVLPGGYVIQSNRSTCVAAAAATLLNHMGAPRTEAEMIRLLGTDAEGTLPSQLVIAMRRLGYSDRTIKVDRDGADDLQAPAVVFVENNIHALTLISVNEELVHVWDPNNRHLTYRRNELRNAFAGAHIIDFTRKNND